LTNVVYTSGTKRLRLRYINAGALAGAGTREHNNLKVATGHSMEPGTADTGIYTKLIDGTG
jgi:hypothetical protein